MGAGVAVELDVVGAIVGDEVLLSTMLLIKKHVSPVKYRSLRAMGSKSQNACNSITNSLSDEFTQFEYESFTVAFNA